MSLYLGFVYAKLCSITMKISIISMITRKLTLHFFFFNELKYSNQKHLIRIKMSFFIFIELENFLIFQLKLKIVEFLKR